MVYLAGVGGKLRVSESLGHVSEALNMTTYLDMRNDCTGNCALDLAIDNTLMANKVVKQCNKH
jgi:hypothetical protein